MPTWTKIFKDAKAQVKHADKEIKTNSHKIEVMKKQKGTPIHIDNVNKEMQTWTKMSRDAKPQVEHAHKEIKGNAHWIEVIKKQKGTPVDKMAMMNTSLEEAKGSLCITRVCSWMA